MKNRNKLLTSVLSIQLLAFGSIAHAQEFSHVNDPVYAGFEMAANTINSDGVNDGSIEALVPASQNVSDNFPFGDNALVETDINEKKFSLLDSADALTEKISDETSEKNISVAKLSFKREGGTKSFSFEQIKTANLNTKLIIRDIDIDQDANKFSAVLKPLKGNYTIEVDGIYSVSVKVPVLAKNISKGTNITQDDIELKNYPRTEILSSNISDVSGIIGKTTTKALSKGKMISEEDIRTPVLVPKNSTVSAIYRTETIEIKALAVALDEGGAGDIIRCKNFDSGKTFKAVVQADGNVLIGSSVKDISLSDAGSKAVNNNIN